MALASAGFTLLELCVLALGFACLGNRLLRWFALEMESHAEHLLVSVATGVIFMQVLLFFVQLSQHIKTGCYVVVALLCIAVITDGRQVVLRIAALPERLTQAPKREWVLFALIAVVMMVEFLTAQAPLTGSDALHYHFTVEQLVLENGFHPIFSISHSFLCGQSHLLILFGLALGSEKLSLALIFLGGLLAALSIVCLAARWSTGLILSALVLLFLLTPIVFWQMSASGAPDVWMALFVSAAVIVFCHTKSAGT